MPGRFIIVVCPLYGSDIVVPLMGTYAVNFNLFINKLFYYGGSTPRHGVRVEPFNLVVMSVRKVGGSTVHSHNNITAPSFPVLPAYFGIIIEVPGNTPLNRTVV